MDTETKLAILGTLFGVAGAAVELVPQKPKMQARGGSRGGSNKHGKLGCTPCQGRADANATLRESAKAVGMPAARAVPKGGI